MIFPDFFPLTQAGELIAIGEYLKLIAESEKTQVIYLQDSYSYYNKLPRDIAYVNQNDLGLYVHYKTYD